jgi:hypothetical protein
MKKQIYLSATRSLLVAFLLLVISMSACETRFDRDSSLPYLDVLNDVENLGIQDMKIIMEAQERLKPYVIVKGGKYQMTASSGLEVNISDRLFRYLKGAMEYVNQKIEDGSLIFLDDKLIEIGDEIVYKIPMIKTRSEQGESNDQYWSHTEWYSFGYVNTSFYSGSLFRV